jgi:hypothetical protein
MSSAAGSRAGSSLLCAPSATPSPRALKGARLDPATGKAVWEEEDYCSPPLAMEREAVLDRYFQDLRVERVEEGRGWAAISHLPPFWGPREGP